MASTTQSEWISGRTFVPSDSAVPLLELADETWRARQAMLVGVAFGSSSGEGRVVSRLRREVEEIAGLPTVWRRALVEDPVVLIALRRAARGVGGSAGSSSALSKGSADDFERDAEQLRRALSSRARVLHSGHVMTVAGDVEVRRHDVDPLIVEVAPPTYTFPQRGDTPPDDSSPYPLSLFRDAVEAALTRIAADWPEARETFAHFVRMLVHLPDGAFRSASADRYAGVVFLSADDMTLLDLEESLVHEYGHQVLYRLMAFDPLVLASADETWTLPWSGSKRDYYGYFHAFFIYTWLAVYFDRVARNRPAERARATERLLEILQGLRAATADFTVAQRFTPNGFALASGVATQTAHLVARWAEMLGSPDVSRHRALNNGR